MLCSNYALTSRIETCSEGRTKMDYAMYGTNHVKRGKCPPNLGKRGTNWRQIHTKIENFIVCSPNLASYSRLWDFFFRMPLNHCSICRVVGWFTPPPLWCLSTPKFALTPTGLVKNSQKHIADPSPSGFTTNRVLCLILYAKHLYPHPYIFITGIVYP